jgi:hypothetical protein
MEENTPAPPHCVVNAYHEEVEGARIRNGYEVRLLLTQLGIPFHPDHIPITQRDFAPPAQ